MKLKAYATFGDNSNIFILGCLTLYRTVTLGSGTRVVFGQNGIADLRNSKAILLAKQCYLEAPVKQIFKEGIEVQGIWEIPTAYPQWFTSELPALDSPGPSESESLDSTLHDWSIEINKAITMKGTGEVFLPKGTYNVSNPIIIEAPSNEVFKKITEWRPATTEFGGNGIMIHVEFGNSGGRGRVKIRRSHTAEGTKVVKNVIVPICGARVLYDNGIAIAGYK